MNFFHYLFKRKIILFLLPTLLIAIYIILGFYNPLITTHYTYTSSKIPIGFDGFRITQITDFHCKDFGEQESELIQAIRDTNPDIIVFTGDSIDDKHTIANYSYLLQGIHDIAPIYYINGNHEYDKSAPLLELLALHNKYGVIDLNDKTFVLNRQNDSIRLTGLDFRNTMLNLMNNISYANTTYFNILLYHGTDKFDGIAPYNYDLVLSGHTHGGIVCLPFIGGIITNQKELFPKYDSGIFTVGHSTMISSRGLGDASIPRFYNPREIVSITLHSSASKSGE